MKPHCSRLLLTYSFLIGLTAPVAAIKFKSAPLKDNSMINYHAFGRAEYEGIDDAFETLSADLNGDEIDDIISVGGSLNLCYPGCGVQPPLVPVGVQVMLSQDDDFIIQDPLPASHSIVVIDMNKDGALDLVLSSGVVLLNDGLGGFDHSIDYNEGEIVPRSFNSDYLSSIPLPSPLSHYVRKQINPYFFVADWDHDEDLDIISPNQIFINDGAFNFIVLDNNLANGQRVYALNLNDDGAADWLVYQVGAVASWVANGSGGHELIRETETSELALQIKTIDLNGDGADDLVQSYLDTTTETVKIRGLLGSDQGGFVEINQDFSEFMDMHPNIAISKLYVKDMDGDGDQDIWVFGGFYDSDVCSKSQSVLSIYANEGNGVVAHSQTIHAIGHDWEDPRFQNSTATMPTLIDLNHDTKPDIVFPGDKPTVWISGEGSRYVLSKYSSMQFNTQVQTLDFNNDGLTDVMASASYNQGCGLIDSPVEVSSVVNSVSGVIWQAEAGGGFTPVNAAIDLSDSSYLKTKDIDGDGFDDIFVTQRNENGASVTQFYGGAGQQNSITFPTTTGHLEFADLNNNGQFEILALNHPYQDAISIFSHQGEAFQFTNLIAAVAGHDQSQVAAFKVADMDGDGWQDVVVQTTSDENSITIWYNNGNTFDASESFGMGVKSIAISDFNHDQKLDIFASNDFHEIWLNRGERVFSTTDYDTSPFIVYPGYDQHHYAVVPSKIEVVDFNADGWDDLVVYDKFDGYVYVNNSARENHYISFFNPYNFEFKLAAPLGYPISFPTSKYHQNNAAFTDFNGDGLLDMVNGSDRFVNIVTQEKEQLPTGLLFDPDYNGHGYSLFDMGGDNLYYNVMYTFNDLGEPEWYAMLNRYSSSEETWRLKRIHGSTAIRTQYDHNNMQMLFNDDPTQAGFLTMYQHDHPVYNQLNGFYRIGDEQRNWQLQPIIRASQRPEVDFSGVWWAGPEDAGWGLTMEFVERDGQQELVIVLYFYDADGEPRWAIGQKAGFEPGQEFTVSMNQIQGYGRLSPLVDLIETPIGLITLKLNEPTQDISQAGTISIDVNHINHQNNRWVRHDLPIGLFSKPRD